MQTIRAQLAPFIRAAGIGKTARATGLHQSNLSAWLNGRNTLKDEHVEALCRHLNLTLTIHETDAVPGARPKAVAPPARRPATPPG